MARSYARALAAPLVACVVAFAFLECTSEGEPASSESPSTSDGGAQPDTSVLPEDSGGTDASDAAADAGPRDARLRLRDGGVVEGPLAARYDHRGFWDAAAEDTFAVLSEKDFAPYPNDRSLRFVSSNDVEAIEAMPTAIPDPRFRAFERARGIVLARPPLDGVAHVIRGNDGYHLEENGSGNFAWDFVRTKSDGTRYAGVGAANSDFYVWDEPVYLPTGGEVVEIVRDAVDNTPGAYPPGAINNFVGVHLGGHYYVYLLHFRSGTIPANVQVGVTLPAGAYLGRVGNSGVTLEPHLHVTLLYYDTVSALPRTWSVPGEFASVHVGASLSGPSTFETFATPQTGSFVSSSPF